MRIGTGVESGRVGGSCKCCKCCLEGLCTASFLCGFVSTSRSLRGPSRGLRRAFVGPSRGFRRAFASLRAAFARPSRGFRAAFARPPRTHPPFLAGPLSYPLCARCPLAPLCALCSPLCVCGPSLRALPSAGLRGLLRPHEAQAKWKVRCLRATVPARSLCGDFAGLRGAFVGPSLGLRRAFARVLSGLRGSLHGLRRAFAGPSSGLRTPSSELRLTNPHKKPAVRSPLGWSPAM